MTSDHIKKLLLQSKGIKIKAMKNHIIVCGWNESVPFLIQNIHHDNIVYKRPITILANISEELFLEKYIFVPAALNVAGPS